MLQYMDQTNNLIYLTAAQVQINHVFAVLHQILNAKICNPEIQIVTEVRKCCKIYFHSQRTTNWYKSSARIE